jgi:hypothetical protein
MERNFESNSHKSKENKTNPETKEKVEKVVTGTVKTKKKNGFSKFFSGFVSEDATNIRSFIVRDVVIPAVKKALSDTIDMILYGDSRRGRSTASKISYSSYYDRERGYGEPRRNEPSIRSAYSFDDIILESRGEAEEVLSHMSNLLDTYGIVSVADLYDLVGISCDYTANKYGWTNIRNATVDRTRDGWMLKMPKAMPIN